MRFIPRKVQVIYSTPLNCKVRSRTQYLSLVLCLHLQSLTDCKVPLSQGPGYVWRWLLIVMISGRGLIRMRISVSRVQGGRCSEYESSSSVREPNSMPELSQLLFVQCLTKRTQWSSHSFLYLLIHFTTVAMRLFSHGPHVTLVM